MYVSFNWAGTLKFGTEFAQAVFERAKHGGKGKTYFDTADPTPNAKAIPDFMEKVLKTNKVDILSLNENEAITYASLLDWGLKEKHARLGFAELAMEAARVLAKCLPARIDLHTTVFSATLKRQKRGCGSNIQGQSFACNGRWRCLVCRQHLGRPQWALRRVPSDLANAVSACLPFRPQMDNIRPKQKLADFLRAHS